MHPSRVEIDIYVRFHRQRRGVGAPFMTCWILGIDETSDRQSKCVCYTHSHAVVVAERGGVEPLELFGLEELLTRGECVRVLPEAVELFV